MNAPFEYPGSELDVFAGAARWKRYFAAHVRPFLRGRVLEVGAGIGAVTRTLCTGSEEAWTCLEPDARLAARLRDTSGRPGPAGLPPVRVLNGTIASLSPEDVFDTILYVDVLEHIDDDAQELRGASRLLGPGGHLIVLSPAHRWLFSPFDEAIGHRRRYNCSSLRAAGPRDLTLVRLRYLDSVGLLASLANRLVLRSRLPSARQIGLWDRVMVPMSQVLDPLLGYTLGKSLIAVWRR